MFEPSHQYRFFEFVDDEAKIYLGSIGVCDAVVTALVETEGEFKASASITKVIAYVSGVEVDVTALIKDKEQMCEDVLEKYFKGREQ